MNRKKIELKLYIFNYIHIHRDWTWIDFIFVDLYLAIIMEGGGERTLVWEEISSFRYFHSSGGGKTLFFKWNLSSNSQDGGSLAGLYLKLKLTKINWNLKVWGTRGRVGAGGVSSSHLIKRQREQIINIKEDYTKQTNKWN